MGSLGEGAGVGGRRQGGAGQCMMNEVHYVHMIDIQDPNLLASEKQGAGQQCQAC